MVPDRKKLIEKTIEDIDIVKREIAAEMHAFFNNMSITHSQGMILHFIKKNKNISVKEIANSFGITSSAATQIVNSLVSKGLLLRKRNPDDRRTLKIELSDEFSNQFDSIKSKSFKILSSLFDVLDDDELSRFYELNNKIAREILSKTQDRKKPRICL